MDLHCFAISIFIDSCGTLKGSFISLYKRLIVAINLVSAYTRSDVQVDCVRVRANCIYPTTRFALVHSAFACEWRLLCIAF